jgi:transcriptional regulator with XRE-family HTH domain
MEFAEWLHTEMNQRGFGPADIAERADISAPTISRILGTSRRPGPDACVAIAQALRLPPELVFRKAGLLPERTDPAPAVTEIVYLFNQLDQAAQEEALVMMRGYLREKLRLAETTPNPSRADA